jgi:hypothetical protein
MPRANFFDSLPLPNPGDVEAAGASNEEPPGPLTGGPVPDGEELTWVYAWLLQNGPEGRAAAAYGESEHDADPFKGEWSVPMEMAEPSDDFTPGRPAQAHAMAWVKDLESGTKEVYYWSEAVMITPPQSTAT